MATLKSHRDVPPGGWHYVARETGQRFEESSLEKLVQRVRDHLSYKGLPTDNVAAEVEEQLCLGLGLDHCKPAPGEDYRPIKDLTQALTGDMAKAANRGVMAFITGGLQFNDKSEAASRAAICRTCPFNKPSSGCSCHAIYRAIEFLIPSTRKQAGISVCMACGCSLQAKVNMPAAVITASLAPDMAFPTWCWQNGMQPLDAPPSP